MARESLVTVDDGFFVGTDAILSYEIFREGSPVDANGVPTEMQDAAGMALKWSLRVALGGVTPPYRSQGTEVLTKTSGSGIALTGTFNVNRTVNTQRVEVAIADTDTDTFTAGRYVDSLKRTDSGAETILSYGTVELLMPTVRT